MTRAAFGVDDIYDKRRGAYISAGLADRIMVITVHLTHIK